MTNQIFTASIQSQTIAQQVPAPMQELTLDEMRAVVGGPIIDNGNAIAPAATTGGK